MTVERRRKGAASPPSGDLTPFAPGNPERFLLPKRWGEAPRTARIGPVGTVCEVEVPSRLHASVLDMNRFDVGLPGGGGIGFAVAMFCCARVVATAGRGVVTGGNRPGIALHLARLFQAATGVEAGLEIEMDDHGRRHMGLGSSIGTITAAAVALNEVFGRPFGLRGLRQLIAHNYCEEAPGDPKQLVPGFETNVGAMAGIHGGMVLATDNCELIYRIPLPQDTRALLILPLIGPPVASGEHEAQALLHRARELDRRDAQAKAHRVLLDLLPAMVAGDLVAAGNVLYDLALMGSKRAECTLHGSGGEEIYRTLRQLRDEGAEIASMSSVGPAVFALSRRPEVWERWRHWNSPQVSGCSLTVPVDNTGARVRLDGVPIPYHFDSWWSQPSYPAEPPPMLGESGPGHVGQPEEA